MSVLDLKEAKERSEPNETHGSNVAPHAGSTYGIAGKGILESFEYGLGIRSYRGIVNFLRCDNHDVLIRRLSFWEMHAMQ